MTKSTSSKNSDQSPMTTSNASSSSKTDPPYDPTVPTPEEEKQFIELGKKQTEQLDPEANEIEREFDSYPTPGTPKKGNKGVSFQSTLSSWTLVTPKDKMRQLRKVKAQEKAAKVAAKGAKQASKKSASPATSDAQRQDATPKEKASYAEKALQEAATKVLPDDKTETVDSSSAGSNGTTESPSETGTGKKNKSKKKLAKMNVSRPYNTYYTMKLKTQANTNPVKELTSKMKLFFEALREVDGSLIIYRFKDIVPTVAIASPDEIPTNINRFKEYFSGANPTPREDHVWASVWIGHSEDVDNLHTNIKYWSMEHDTFLYKKKLQEKQTVREYFLLYSTDKIDVEVLHATVSSEIKKVTNKEYKFAFVWTVIKSKGAYVNTESKDKKGSQYIKALHVEVPRNENIATYQILLKFLGSSSNYQLLHRNLRMIPVLTADTPTHKKAKISRLIGKQQRYINNISTAVSYDLQDVDYLIPSLQKTLRQMIMEIEQVASPEETLFLSIDYNDYSSGYVLTFPTHLESEARDCISQLPSFLHWMYGDNVLEQLTDFAVERAHAAPWSEELMRAVSQEDTALDNLLQEADQLDWLRNDNEVVIEDTPVSTQTSAFLFNRAVDDDSVSTFRSKKTRPTVNETPTKKQKANEVQDVEMVDVTENTSIPAHTVTPESKQIQQLDTPLLNNNDLTAQVGIVSKETTPPTTEPIGPLLQNRQSSKDGNETSDHVSESGVSL